MSLELGGKSPLLVFDDVADIDQVRSPPQSAAVAPARLPRRRASLTDSPPVRQVVEWIMFGCFWTNGQICSATSRLLVQDTIAAKLLDALKKHAEAIVVSDPLQREPPCRMGPLVNAAQYEKVKGMIAQARAAAARSGTVSWDF